MISTTLLLLSTATALDLSGLPRAQQRLASTLSKTHPAISQAAHRILNQLSVDQLSEAIGADTPHKDKIASAKRAARAARLGEKRQSTFDPTTCYDGTGTPATLTSSLEVTTEDGTFDQEAFFLVQGPATVFIEPRFSPHEVDTSGNYEVEVFSTSCYEVADRYTNGTAIEISTNGTVGVLLSMYPNSCDDGLDFGFSLEPEEATSDCDARTTFDFGVSLGVTESECGGNCANREYCSTDGTCVCDNFQAACFNRDDCPAMDPGFEADDKCSTSYNDKSCCTREGANQAISTLASSMSIFGIDVTKEEYAECWEEVLAPAYCAEKCLADSSKFDEDGDLVQCKSVCEKTADVCKAFIEASGDEGEAPPELDAEACADLPTTDCFAGAASMALSGLAALAAVANLL